MWIHCDLQEKCEFVNNYLFDVEFSRKMNEIKPDTPNTSWDNVPHDIMVPVPIKIHPPVIIDHSLPINHGPMPVPQTPLVCIFTQHF